MSDVMTNGTAEAQEAYARGVAQYSALSKELSELRDQLSKMEYASKCDKVEMESLRVALAASQDECRDLKGKYEEQLAIRLLYEGFFHNLSVSLSAFSLEAPESRATKAIARKPRRMVNVQTNEAGEIADPNLQAISQALAPVTGK